MRRKRILLIFLFQSSRRGLCFLRSPHSSCSVISTARSSRDLRTTTPPRRLSSLKQHRLATSSSYPCQVRSATHRCSRNVKLLNARNDGSDASLAAFNKTASAPLGGEELALLNPVRVKSHTSDAAPDLNVPPSLEAKLRDPAEPSSSQSSFASFVRDTVFFGMEPTPTLVAIAVIYFVEGALGLARLAQTYLLKDELHLGPAELSALSGIFALPWTIKPLYGFVSDGFPLFGYQRKSYLVVAGVLGTLSYWLLGQTGLWSSMETGSGVVGTVAALLLSSTCIAFSDVVADGIVVQRTRQASDSGDGTVAGGLQSLCWGASALGGLLSAYWSGSLLEVLSVREVFSLAAVLPFLVSLIAFGIDEQPAETSSPSTSTAAVDGLREQVSTLWQALKQPDIWRPALFLFLWQATPTSDGAFFFFLTDNTGLGLGLGPEFLGRVRLVTSIAGLAGVWLYQRYFRSSSIKSILFWSTVVSFPLGMLPVLLITHANRALGIPDTALIYGDDVILAALGQISFLPTLVLAARICPPGVEAVLFATLMSIFNGASTVGTEIGAALTKLLGVTESNFHNLAWLTILCNVTSLLPLLAMRLLDGVGDMTEADKDSFPVKRNTFPRVEDCGVADGVED